jgi:hypothetical protein
MLSTGDIGEGELANILQAACDASPSIARRSGRAVAGLMPALEACADIFRPPDLVFPMSPEW